MYSKTQIYSKNKLMIFYFYESWRYIEPYHFTLFEPCLDTMWLIWKFSLKLNILIINET